MSAKMLMVFCDETDLWKGEERLYSAIVRKLHRNGIAGATVLGGVMGYGVHRRIHKKGLFGVSDERPILVLAVDEEEKLRAVLPIIVPMVKEGLINLVDTEVISMGTGAKVSAPMKAEDGSLPEDTNA
jgi:PII-like signaling protein